MKLGPLIIAISLACPVGVTKADVLYTSSAFAYANNPNLNSWCSSCNGTYHVYDLFTLSTNSTVTGTNFAVQSSYGPPDRVIDITIWDSSLTNLLYAETVSSYGRVELGNDVAMISSTISGINLDAGSYYMGWYDPVAMGIPGYIGDGSGSMFQSDGGSGSGDYVAAFQVIGVVPEPETYAMLLVGLGLIGFVARRRKELSI